jgi:hypothetical protein
MAIKRIDVNDTMLTKMFLETKALQKFLADPFFVSDVSATDGFYRLANEVITEVCGPAEKEDFDNISAMCAFYTPKQNVLWKLLVDRKIIPKKKKMANRKTIRTSSYKEWSKLHPDH